MDLTKKLRILLVLTLFSLILPTLLIDSYFASDDIRLPELSIDIAVYKDINYIWQYYIGFGEPGHLNIVDIFPYHFIIYLLSKIGLNYIIVQKIFFAFSFIAAGLSMHYLLCLLLRERRPMGAFFGALFYAVNPFAIAQPFYHFYHLFMLPYIFIPLLLISIINIIDHGDKKHYLQAIVIFLLNLSSISNPAYLIVEFIPVGFYVIFALFTYPQKKSVVQRGIIYIALFVLINGFWILPFADLMHLNSYSNVVNSPIRDVGFEQKYAHYSTLLNNFRLVNWPWYYKAPGSKDFGYQFKYLFERYKLYDTYLFLPALAFVLAILLNSKRKIYDLKFIFFTLFTIVILFLIKGPAPPFESVFYSLDKIVPFYTEMFKNLYSKYGFLLSLGYSVMFGYFVAALECRIKGKSKTIALFLTIFLLISPLFMPFALKLLGPEYGYVHIPDSYFDSANIINSYEGEIRILELPLSANKGNFKEYKWGYLGAGIYPKLLSRSTLDRSSVFNKFNNEALNNIESAIENKDQSLLEKLFNLYNVRFIVFHKDDIRYPDNADIKKNMNILANFTGVFTSPEIDLYIVPDAPTVINSSKKINNNTSIINLQPKVLPSIYSSTTQIIISTLNGFTPTIKPNSFNPAKQNIIIIDQNKKKTITKINSSIQPSMFFQKINPTKYKIRIENASEPFYLIFSESYHPGWNAYINTDELQCTPFALYEKAKVTECYEEYGLFEASDLRRLFSKSISEEKHLTVNGFANGWYIDPKELDLNQSWTLTLFFKPQLYFYIGLILSGLTLVGYSVYFLKVHKNDTI